MILVVFEEWLRKWDQELNTKIVLYWNIVFFEGNSSVSPPPPPPPLPLPQSFQVFNLVFLPPNTTSEIQYGQEIINTLKLHYRKCRDKCVLRLSGLGVADFKITLLDVRKMARTAWDRVTPVTIENCFRKQGYLLSESTSEQE